MICHTEWVGQLIGERDQAVEDIKMLGRLGANICPLCSNYSHGEGNKACISCLKLDNFEYRGIVKEENNESVSC